MRRPAAGLLDQLEVVRRGASVAPRRDLELDLLAFGQTAQAASAKKLVLSHFMPPYTDQKIERIVSRVKEHYTGEVIVAHDLLAIPAQ